LLIEVW